MKRNLHLILIMLIGICSFQSQAKRIEGYVVDTDSLRVAGANIKLYSLSPQELKANAVSDQNGNFVISDVEITDSCLVDVSAKGYEPFSAILDSNENPVKLILRHSATDLTGIDITGDSKFSFKNSTTFIPTKGEKKRSSDGTELLLNMAIPEINVNLMNNSVTTASGDGVTMFINGNPASQQDIQGIRTMDITKVEYLTQPTDPRFEGARYVINFVTVKYDGGGYTKLSGLQKLTMPSGDFSVYSHYEKKKTVWDLVGGFNYHDDKHIGLQSDYNYLFDNQQISKIDRSSGTNKARNGYASVRMKYISGKTSIANKLGMQINNTPVNNTHGTSTIDYLNSAQSLSSQFNQIDKRKSYGLAWNGNYYFKLNKAWDLSTNFNVSYGHTDKDYRYDDYEESCIINDISEEAWQGTLSANLRKRIPIGSLSFRVSAGYSDNKIDYNGTTPADVRLKDWYVTPSVSLNMSLEKWYLMVDVMLPYQETRYNGQKELYFFPKFFAWGNCQIDEKNSLMASLEFSTWSNSLSMKSPNMVFNDYITAVRGNPKLKNYNVFRPMIDYSLDLNKYFSLEIFSDWTYYRRPSTNIWSLEMINGRTVIVEDYINSGMLSNLSMGASGTVRLFDNKLVVKASVTQNYIKQTGVRKVNDWPISVYAQANYNIGPFSIMGVWQKATEIADHICTYVNPQYYSLGVTYGNGNFNASLRANNVFNNTWKATAVKNKAANVEYRDQMLSSAFHRQFVLTLYWSFSYGKKSKYTDRIEKSMIPNSAIIE